MSKETILGEVVREFLALYPDYPKRTLARKLCEERPDLFRDIEHARGLIRHKTGAQGDKKRIDTADKSQFRPSVSIKEAMSHYALKAERIRATEDYIINDPGRYGIISDVHFPYHDESALETALEALYDANIDALLLNGDIVDFYQASRYSKDPRRASLQQEREMCDEFWSFLRDVWPDKPIYYKMGNHEARMEDFLFRKGRELVGVPELELDKFLYCNEYHIRWIGDKQIIKMGKLNVLHGHETGRSFFNPVNAARGLFLRGKANALCGHYHATSNHHEGDLNDKATGTWSMGCLCNLRPEYYPTAYTKWNHGFAIVDLHDDQTFSVDNFMIKHRKVL